VFVYGVLHYVLYQSAACIVVTELWFLSPFYAIAEMSAVCAANAFSI
jgi:hypothetical protein